LVPPISVEHGAQSSGHTRSLTTEGRISRESGEATKFRAAEERRARSRFFVSLDFQWLTYYIFRVVSRPSNKSRYLPFISFDKKLISIKVFHLGIAKEIVFRTFSMLFSVSSHLSIPK